MLRTRLTDDLGLRYPLVGAPMAGPGTGRLAHAVSAAGGLGMISMDRRANAETVIREADAARGPADRQPFGVGLMIWSLAERPELVDLALRVRPRLVSLSFGVIETDLVNRIHKAGSRVAAQVSDRAQAIAAAQSGVDYVVAQGTEAGGHTGPVSTLPLLQLALRTVDLPVLAAGGIGSPEGMAAVLAGGAEGAWVGTALLGSEEASIPPAARARLCDARETDTVHTHAFDAAQGLAWPEAWPGRALQNAFTRTWQGRESEIPPTARESLIAARAAGDFDQAFIYAGQAVGLVDGIRPAGTIVRDLAEGAERILRERLSRWFSED